VGDDPSDYELTPVDHDPFAMDPVEGDPFGGQPPDQSQPPPMDPVDRDMMIRTIAGEAGNQPPEGQAAVAHTILNRVADGGYGEGIQGVLQAPVKPGSAYHQFSVWNAPGMQDSSKTTHSLSPDDPQYAAIGSVVDKVHSGAIPDPTNGATHYYAPKSMPGGKAPPWAAALAKQNQVRIGDQIFVGGSTGPGQQLPSQIVGGYADEGASAS
jgi:conjugal transfer mating pair stabilization protein TraG